MVTKESLVCTKEQAIILKSLNVPQKSLFAWIEQKDQFGTMNIIDDNYGVGYAAFTASELMEKLPSMGRVARFFFILKTGLDPVKVADVLINKIK